MWEEDEFWNELSWQIDPTGKLGIRKHFESPYRPGEKITIDEYYRYIFERVPGLPQAATAKGLDPLAYMREVRRFRSRSNRLTRGTNASSAADELKGTEIDPERQIVIKNDMTVGIDTTTT